MKRVLVLGGGGIIGVAWESGLATGLHQAGVDLRAVDAIVGTSAGAIVGAQLASGRLPGDVRRTSTAGGDAVPIAAIDPTKLDPQLLGQIFKLWGSMELTTSEQTAAIGKLAQQVGFDNEAAWISEITRAIRVSEWPAKPLLITAVDAISGQRRVFDRSCGAPLPRVIAASAAVPGLCSPLEIDGRLYIDGQVHSSTHADVVAAWKPAQVLIVMPTNGPTAAGLGRHAERMLQTELAILHAAGCTVLVKTPTKADTARFGNNLMDPSRASDAYECGLEAGRAWASEID
jgi:NTE family protein